MASFDFIVVGTGSGGGTAVRRLIEQFPFSTVLALESGKDLPTPADRRADSLQSETDDKLDKTWPFWADQVVTNYGDPGSPYGPGGPLFSPGLSFIAPPFEQSMGKVVGGSSHHNGMMALRGSPEDYDEWDYALRDGSTKWSFPAGASITWGGAASLACNASAKNAVDAALATGKAVFIASTDNPKVSPPFRVLSTGAGPNINITAGVEIIPNTGASLANVFCSPWNRARMLECYIDIEFDIDSNADPLNPNGVPAAHHGVSGWTEIGRIGRRETQNTDPTKPWMDQRPGVTVPRQSITQLQLIESSTNSAAVDGSGDWTNPDNGIGGTTFPYLDDFNEWQIRTPTGASAPWGRTWQIPLNYVGFDSTGQPVAGGHNVAKIGRYDKYDERRSTLVTAIDPVRTYRAISVTLAPLSPDFAVSETVTGVTSGATGIVTFAETSVASAQRIQVSMTSGEFSDGENLTSSGGADSTMTGLPVTQLTLVDRATVDKVKLGTTVDLVDMTLVAAAPFGTDPAVGDVCKGLVSGATAVVVEASSNVTLTNQAWVRVQVVSGTFLQGETVRSPVAGGTWAATAFQVTRVLKPTGVIYWKADENGTQQMIEVDSANVVLAAGPFNTPAILQRSGVGPADRLASAGVEQVLNLSGVGDRAIQHTIWNPFVWFMNAQHPSDQASYVLDFSGAFRSGQSRDAASLGLPAGTTLWEVGTNNTSGPLLFDEDFDTVAIFVAVGGSPETGFASAAGGFGLGSKQVNAGPQMQAELGFGVYTTGRLAIASLAGFKPRSRGQGITITSTSAFDLPMVDHGIVSDWRSKDAEALLEYGDQLFVKLTDPTIPDGFLANSGVGFSFPFVTPPSPPGGGLTASRVSQTVATVTAAYHLVGTCTMGSETDAGAPLDERGRLKHVTGIRVVDTSIMPTHVRANPHLPTVAHAFNIVSMIAEDGGC